MQTAFGRKRTKKGRREKIQVRAERKSVVKVIKKQAILWGLMGLLAMGCGCARQEGLGEAESILESTTSVSEGTSRASEGAGTGVTKAEALKSSEEESTASTEAPEENQEYTIVMVGDVLLHTPVEESCRQEDGSYNYDSLFAHTKDVISEADLALVNQEVIIGGAELGISGYPCFNADFGLCDSLVEAGFDVICHATNHALDKGRAGLLSCAKHWKESYPQITVLGIHDTKDTSTAYGADPVILEVGDIRIAVLNYTYGTNGIALPADMPFGVDLLKEAQVEADIRRAEEIADFTIVCPHWGTEYRLVPDASQEKWTKLFLENGADLVLGTHPHVIEPVEWVRDEETGHEMLVYYSLGNFVNWTSGTGKGVANRMVGGMAEVTIGRLDTGEVKVTSYGIRPLVSHVTSGAEGVTAYFLEDYSEKLAAENEIVFQDSDFSREYCVDLCDQVWGNLWTTDNK